MRLLLLLVAAAAPSCMFAQQSMFESGDGRSALYLRQSAVAVNFGDSKANFGYVHNYSSNPWFYAAGAYATSNSGVTSLFSSDKPKAPEGGVDGVLGVRYDPPPNCDNCDFIPKNYRLLIDGGFGRSSFYLYPAGVTPTSSTTKTSLNRFRALMAMNRFAGGWVLGFAAGAERRNNLSDLKSVNLDTIVAGTSGSASTIVKSQAGYYGAYKEYIGAPVYTDLLLFGPFVKWKGAAIDHRLGFDLMTRSDIASVNRTSAGGLGVYLLDKKDNFKAIGGVSATYDGTKLQLSLTVGLTGSNK
jgi:hypothetical protein